MIFRRPVAHAVEQQIPHHRMVTVQRIARAAVIAIAPVFVKRVVGRVVNPFVGNDRAAFVAFAGMIEDHVKHDFNAVAMQFLDDGFEFVRHHRAVFHCASRRIARFGRKKSERAVAPVVHQALIGAVKEVLKFVELKNRHQFDAIDAKFFQIRNLLANRRKCSRMLHFRRRMARQPPDVDFINDEVFHRNFQRAIRFPVEIFIYDARSVLIGLRIVRRSAPDIASADGAGIRIHQRFLRIKAVNRRFALFRSRAGAIHPKAVFKVFIIQVEDGHREDVADAQFQPVGIVALKFLEKAAKRDFDERFRRIFFEQH